MPDNTTIFAFPQPATESKTQPLRKLPDTAVLLKDRPVVLDMGEASREEGFRLYGCR